MATVGAKNQPIVQATDTFNPVSDINTLSNWVANNYASVKILTGSTLHTAVTGADLFAGLTVYETSTDQFWTYTGTAWYLQSIGSNPRIELTQTVTQTSYIPTATNKTLGVWTTTQARGGFSVASGVVTVPFTGRYNIWLQATVGAQATAAGTRIVRVVTGSGIAYQNSTAPVNGNASYMSVAALGVPITAADTLTPQLFTSAGASLDWFSSSSSPSKFIVEYVGA